MADEAPDPLGDEPGLEPRAPELAELFSQSEAESLQAGSPCNSGLIDSTPGEWIAWIALTCQVV